MFVCGTDGMVCFVSVVVGGCCLFVLVADSWLGFADDVIVFWLFSWSWHIVCFVCVCYWICFRFCLFCFGRLCVWLFLGFVFAALGLWLVCRLL